MSTIGIRRALLSVSDKTGLIELAKGLVRHGVELVSTGGTYQALIAAGIGAIEVSDYTGFPEMLDGRLKTLHPKIHGGLLFRRDDPGHLSAITAHAIRPIDMVVINLYPFEKTVAQAGVTLPQAIEQIDIGGPAMIRSAAKNHEAVAVITDPRQYAEVLEELDTHQGRLPQHKLRHWAAAAFARTSDYDRNIHAFLASQSEPQDGPADPEMPAELTLRYRRKRLLRYGENPHQRGAFYVDPDHPIASVATAEQIHGKELSYNNILDLDAALALVRDFDRPAVAIIKHNNPCGAAVAETLAEAFDKAYAGDPISAFGSVIGFNRPVDAATALLLTDPGRFVEGIIAPAFEPDALVALRTRPTWKENVRLLQTGDLARNAESRQAIPHMRPIEGGLLRQTADDTTVKFLDHHQAVTRRSPAPAEVRDLEFAWHICKFVRSNAIVLVKNESLVGVGAGQMSRVDSVFIATHKAQERAKGSALASDAFFPFRDGVDLAGKAGVTSIVQPGGSKRDQDSINACNEFGIAMILTGQRHFRH